MTMGTLRLGVLASGTGTNFDAIAGAIADGKLEAEVAVVVCNRPGAPVTKKARDAGIEVVELDHAAYASRDAFDAAVADALTRAGAELVVMAGFDRLVTAQYPLVEIGFLSLQNPAHTWELNGLN